MNRQGKTLTLPPRRLKPREYGITAINDVGVPTGELCHILEDFDQYADFAKLGIGSAYLIKDLKRKLDIYRRFDIPVCFGGTLFEKYYYQNKLDDYRLFMKDVGLQWVEVSHGTVNIPIGKLMDVISLLEEDFNVVAEVGKKRMDEIPDPAQWMNDIDRLLKAGVRYVVLEGRNSADAGIYNPDGSLRRELVSSITTRIDSRRLIFEAPTAKSQIQLIRLLGPNVNLGNVLFDDLMLLECQRQALRSDTFFHTDAADPSLVLDLAEVAH